MVEVLYQNIVMALLKEQINLLHKNQYCGSSFQYNNEIYLFAGYGLFTHKNILTRYDFKLKEWYLVPYKSKEYPNPAAYFKSILIGENFYVFGGYTPIDNSVYGKINDPNILWKFNLKMTLGRKQV